MKSFAPFYLFTFLKSFEPITPFTASYLINSKKFRNTDIYNKIIPVFFYSSLISIFFTIFVVHRLTSRFTMVLSSALEAAYLLLLFLMPPNSFPAVYLATFMHSMSTMFFSFSAVYPSIFARSLYSDGARRRETVANVSNFKRGGAILASMLGQNLYMHSGTQTPNFLVSALCTTAALLASLSMQSIKSTDKSVMQIFGERGLEALRAVYSGDTVFYSAMHIVSTTIYMSFNMFAASIFIEKKRDSEVPQIVLTAIKVATFPIQIFTEIFMQIYNYFAKSEKKNLHKKEIIFFGYIDSLSKIFGIVATHFLVKIKIENLKLAKAAAICYGLALMLSMFFMSKSNSLALCYLIYVVGYSIAQTSQITSKNGVYNSSGKFMKIVISINLFIESLLHILISWVTKYFKMSVSQKLLCYFLFCVPFLILSIVLLIFN